MKTKKTKESVGAMDFKCADCGVEGMINKSSVGVFTGDDGKLRCTRCREAANRKFTRATDIVYAAQKDRLLAEVRLRTLAPRLIAEMELLSPEALDAMEQHQTAPAIEIPHLYGDSEIAGMLYEFLAMLLMMARADAIMERFGKDAVGS